MNAVKDKTAETPDPKKNRPKDPQKRSRDRELDKELEDSFPASDPPAITQPVHDNDD